ncbi:MAG: porin [Burkholderiaceae bacterium]|jgi:predicted porin|nr:porin [Burkholderiaceae bacterium]
MKKSLVALAVLAVAGVASAQSSVTLFGTVDYGLSYYQTSSNPATKYSVVNGYPVQNGSIKQSEYAMSSGNETASRIGFRGVEDLGGGLAASFWLEGSLGSLDSQGAVGGNGTLGGSSFFNRRATVSLSGPFGELRIGRDYVPTYWNDTNFDPFSTNGVGTNLITKMGQAIFANTYGAYGQNGSPSSYIRHDNTVGYFLPGNLGGFYGQLQYAPNGSVKVSGVNDPNYTNGWGNSGGAWGARFGWTGYGADVAVSYGSQNANDHYTNGGQVKLTTLNLGGTYDFGAAKVFAEASQINNKTSNDVNGTFPSDFKAWGALLGVSVPVGPGVIKASYGHVQASCSGDPNIGTYRNNLCAVTGRVPGYYNLSNPKSDQIAIGYVHNLSKRTAVYGTAAYIRDRANPMDLTTGGLVGFSRVGDHTTYSPVYSWGYDLGIRHSF